MTGLVLTIAELQKELKIGRSKAYELIAREDFPSARLGRRIVIPVDALNEWLKRGGTDANVS